MRTQSYINQKGDMLIEALVSVVIVLLLGMGPLYISSRMMVSQRHNNYQSVALEQLRSLIQTQDPNILCNGVSKSITVVGTNLPVTVNCTSKINNIQIGGTSITPTGVISKDISLSVTNETMFGSPGTLIVTQ